MTEPTFASASEQAALIRARKIGCLELLDLMIARVTQIDASLNAIVVRDFDRARDRARALDGEREPVGPLHGVPMTVKESFDVAGLPTTWGISAHRDNVAVRDALAVERLRGAGAVIFGKTNVPKSLGDWQSYNDIYGVTKSPWAADRSPGGSSGGSGAAVAAGLTALEMGSDIGGSIRVPAHFCGVFGHKPTHGLLPGRGHSLVSAAAPADISVIGPLARSAADLALALDLLSPPDPQDSAIAISLPAPPASIAGLRVALWPAEAGVATSAETSSAIEALGRDMAAAGAIITRARPAFDVTAAYHVFLLLLYAALSGRMPPAELERARRRKAGLDPDDTSADAVMLRSFDPPHREWLAANEARHQFRRVWNAFLGEHDVLLCPVLGTTALLRTETGETWERTVAVDGVTVPYNDLLFWPGIVGGFLLPASVAPIDVSADGLPIGVQIVGRQHADRTTIAVAGFIEQMRGFRRPPGY